jgi:hypothetical protein
LSSIGPASTDSLPELIAIAELEKGLVKRQAVVAIGTLGRAAAAYAPTLLIVLSVTPNTDLRREVIGALGNTGPPELVLPSLITTLADSRVQTAGINAIVKFGTVAVPYLRNALQSPDVGIRSAALTSIGSIGAPARDAFHDLVTLFAGDSELAVQAAYARGRVAPGLQDSALSNPAIERDLRQALTLAQRLWPDLPDDQRLPFQDTAIGPLFRSISIINQTRNAANIRRWLAAAVAVCLVSLTVVAFLVSVRLRRTILIQLGRRWSIVPGTCDYDGNVFLLADQIHIQVRDLRNAQSTAYQERLSSTCGLASGHEQLQTLRAALKPATTIALAVEEEVYGTPWAIMVGSPWSTGKSATIVGQLCGTRRWTATSLPRSREIAFAALGDGTALPQMELYAVREEIDAVSTRFRRWGAVVLTPRPNAKCADLREALMSADVVHVSAHADPDGVYLGDRRMDVGDLDDDLVTRLRCRLLVLSACNAGRLTNCSFVYRLVASGVNVLAALQPVRDQTCQVFFEEFYKALLPTSGFAGVEIAEAVRSSADACSRRFGNAEHVLGLSGRKGLWRNTLDAFILYGDPSSQLRLRPSGRGI